MLLLGIRKYRGGEGLWVVGGSMPPARAREREREREQLFDQNIGTPKR